MNLHYSHFEATFGLQVALSLTIALSLAVARDRRRRSILLVKQACHAVRVDTWLCEVYRAALSLSFRRISIHEYYRGPQVTFGTKVMKIRDKKCCANSWRFNLLLHYRLINGTSCSALHYCAAHRDRRA